MYAGFNMIYFLAALQAVDRELYDAAAVDGANAWHRFLQVTLPGIKPVLMFVVILCVIGSFQLFELPWFMLNSGAGPEQAGLTVVMYLYVRGFVPGDLGYASAVGWVLALGVLGVSLLQLRFVGGRQGGQGAGRRRKADARRTPPRVSESPEPSSERVAKGWLLKHGKRVDVR
jgi:ABC-type sugar transport system permease subunit